MNLFIAFDNKPNVERWIRLTQKKRIYVFYVFLLDERYFADFPWCSRYVVFVRSFVRGTHSERKRSFNMKIFIFLSFNIVVVFNPTFSHRNLLCFFFSFCIGKHYTKYLQTNKLSHWNHDQLPWKPHIDSVMHTWAYAKNHQPNGNKNLMLFLWYNVHVLGLEWHAIHTTTHRAERLKKKPQNTCDSQIYEDSLMAQHHFENRKFLLTINGNHANNYLFIFRQNSSSTSRKYINIEKFITKVDWADEYFFPLKSNFHKIFTKSAG